MNLYNKLSELKLISFRNIIFNYYFFFFEEIISTIFFLITKTLSHTKQNVKKKKRNYK